MTLKTGTLMFAPVTNIRPKWRSWAVSSASTPTIKPGVSHKNSKGISKASHNCSKSGSLVGAFAVDSSGEMHRIVGDNADGFSFDARERCNHANAVGSSVPRARNPYQPADVTKWRIS